MSQIGCVTNEVMKVRSYQSNDMDFNFTCVVSDSDSDEIEISALQKVKLTWLKIDRFQLYIVVLSKFFAVIKQS